MFTRSLFASLIVLAGCTAGPGADSGDTSASNGLSGDEPPMPAANNATIRSEGVDTTFACDLEESGFYLVESAGTPLLQLSCTETAGSGATKALAFSASGEDFGVGTFESGTSAEEAVNKTLQVVLYDATTEEGWVARLDGDGGTFFSNVLTIDVLGGDGERVAGTFQATWDKVQRDTDGNGATELVDQPSALSFAFDYLRG